MDNPKLPLELIDEILKHLDAISLARSRQVCRSWRDLHSQRKYNLVWRNACFREIGEDVLIELRGSNADLSASSDMDWEDLYKEWYRSRHIGEWPSVITELRGHTGPVWDVKFSGDRVISCGQDFTIRIWDTWTTQCISTILGHRNSICSIALRISLSKPSGATNSPHDLLVSGSRDCSVKVWDLNSLLLAPYQPPTSSSCLVTFHGHTACVNCVAVDSNLVASASDDCSVRVWDLTTGQCHYVLRGLENWVKFVRLWKQELLLCVTDSNFLHIRYLVNIDPQGQAHDTKPYSSVLLQDESADSSLVILGAVLRGKTVLVLTQNDGLFVWENGSQCSILQNVTLNGHNANNIPRGECLAMRGALVAIGTRSGAVYIYHIDGKWKNQVKGGNIKFYTIN
ncbi:F-box/WD repeat-containing protein 7 [Acropora cervicornis]|uniref:F-box/WD repeat-containing protein 7 n=1 Tax=Acropora cervicornis TaxID=6130 RepID=A0AAD9UYH6_ACRCE|nr:F-box/WD repeat-containing protein 7 [Acropora cervicornis]